MARPAEPLRPLRGPRASHTGGLISTRNQRTGFTYRAARLAGPCFIPPVLLDPNQVPSTRRCKATWEERLCGWGWAQARARPGSRHRPPPLPCGQRTLEFRLLFLRHKTLGVFNNQVSLRHHRGSRRVACTPHGPRGPGCAAAQPTPSPASPSPDHLSPSGRHPSAAAALPRRLSGPAARSFSLRAAGQADPEAGLQGAPPRSRVARRPRAPPQARSMAAASSFRHLRSFSDMPRAGAPCCARNTALLDSAGARTSRPSSAPPPGHPVP